MKPENNKCVVADPEELWDKFSMYVDEDLSTLQTIAGTTVMSKTQFMKAVAELPTNTILEQTPIYRVDGNDMRQPIEIHFIQHGEVAIGFKVSPNELIRCLQESGSSKGSFYGILDFTK